MPTVMDCANTFKQIIKDFTPRKDEIETNICKKCYIYRYAIMYLIAEGKLNPNDDMSKWFEYQRNFTTRQHYTVANSYLRSVGENEMTFEVRE